MIRTRRVRPLRLVVTGSPQVGQRYARHGSRLVERHRDDLKRRADGDGREADQCIAPSPPPVRDERVVSRRLTGEGRPTRDERACDRERKADDETSSCLPIDAVFAPQEPPAMMLTALMPTSLPYVAEPSATKRSYNEGHSASREASLRQSSDFSKLVYRVWKDDLRAAGVTWQTFLSAASMNRNAWRSWLDGDLTWRGALVELVEEFNQKATGHASFALAEQR
jgi:hypothetical protein